MVKEILSRCVGFACKIIGYPLMHWPAVAKARVLRWDKVSNIKEIMLGKIEPQADCACIFLLWQPRGLSPSVERALQALNECHIDVIIVSNSDLDPGTLDRITSLSSRIILRCNRGYDFGGFKDATVFLFGERQYKRYIYLNDSVFFLKEGLTDLLQALKNSDADVCGSFENWEFSYHIQSFCFSVSSQIFLNERFRSFWMNYLPVNSRVHAIKKGEISLAFLLRTIANEFDVIYTVSKLKAAIDNRAQIESGFDWHFIPRYMRPIIIERLISIRGMDTKEQNRIYWNDLSLQLAKRSQVHTAGFLFVKYLRSPIIKKDIVYRLQFSPHDVENILSEVGRSEYAKEIMNFIRQKGSGYELPLHKRILFNAGLA